jgi:hypothetical protein
MENLPRWFSLSDGTNEVVANVYDCLNFNQDYETIGGSSVVRFMSGAGLKQQNWQRLRTTISGSGGYPFGFSTLDYSKLITIKCGVPRAIVNTTNTFTLPVNRRLDVNYEPYTLKMVEGFWVPELFPGIATAYKLVYFPQLVCLMEPPKESFSWEGSPPTTWSITAEEA